jgi:hypothetical protein
MIAERSRITPRMANYFLKRVRDYSEVHNVETIDIATVAKTYFITLENVAATPLELYSRISGNRILRAHESGGKFATPGTPAPAVVSDSYYLNRGKYDYVPLIYTNRINNSYNYINNPPYQSSQLLGQFIYGRYKDVAGTENYYVDFNVDSNTVIDLSASPIDEAEYTINPVAYSNIGSNVTDFIWSGNGLNATTNFTDLAAASDYDNSTVILLHEQHPLCITNPSSSTIYANRLVTNSKAANKNADDVNGKRQTAYFVATGGPVLRSSKCAFKPDDQWTLGKASVGSYLFLAPTDETQLSVNGDDELSIKKIEFGTNKSVQIPVVFQYRMTDFGGVGDTGIGFVGGDRTGATRDLTYAKRMGFDINIGDNEKFSFDIEVFAKYRSNKLNLEKVPSRDVRLALDDLNKNVSITPSITTSSNL